LHSASSGLVMSRYPSLPYSRNSDSRLDDARREYRIGLRGRAASKAVTTAEPAYEIDRRWLWIGNFTRSYSIDIMVYFLQYELYLKV